MLTDHANKARGVQVLGEVNENLDAIFIHLLENPALCDSLSRPKASRKHPLDLDNGGCGVKRSRVR